MRHERRRSRPTQRPILHVALYFQRFIASHVVLTADSGRLRLSKNEQQDEYVQTNDVVPGRDFFGAPHSRRPDS